MPEASFQHLTSNISGVEPQIGDALYGELIINTAEGRIWVGDENRIPIELGGAIKNYPIGDPNYCNYASITLSSSEDLPIRTFDPTKAVPNYYRKAIYYIELLTTDINTTFSHQINWGENFLQYKSLTPTDSEATNPIDGFKQLNRKFIIELSTFGQSSELIGRLLWIG